MPTRQWISRVLALAVLCAWSSGCGGSTPDQKFQGNLDDVANAAAKGKEQVKAEPRSKPSSPKDRGKLADDDTF